MYKLYDNFREDNICLTYMGLFSDKITSMLIDLSDNYLSTDDQLGKLSRKVTFLISECFQNVIRHRLIEDNYSHEALHHKDFFQINILNDRIVVSSANLIDQGAVKALDDKINHINTLDSIELKALYLDVLGSGHFTAKGGASLGLIDMVRKSGLPIKKKFVPFSENYSQVFLSLEIAGNSEIHSHKIDISEIEKSYNTLVDKKILILYKGDFSEDSISSLIEMLHNNFVEDSNLNSKKIKNIISIIEVLQNVSKHGKSFNGHKEGIFTLSEVNGDMVIECSNFIDSEKHDFLKQYLETIKSSSQEEIEEFYRKKLYNEDVPELKNSGLGLLEIARFTKNDFNYNIQETAENEYFFSLSLITV